MTTQTQETITNGVNITKLGETVNAVKNDPGLAAFKFRATNKWIDGGFNEFTISELYGTRQRIAHEPPFVFKADEPEALLGKDRGPNPVEYVLGALSACMTTTLAYKSAGKGLNIEKIASEHEGDIDLRGFLEFDPKIEKGYKEIRVKFKVKGDPTVEEIKEILKKSPVYDTLVRPIKISIDVEKV